MPALRLPTFAVVLCLFMSACSSAAPDPEQQKKDEEQARALGRDTDKTVFDDMIQSEDKARAVEGVTLGHKADLDKALEQQEKGNAADNTDEAR
jgi:PBP1b-binding outer membrane lipoprotein LpoB